MTEMLPVENLGGSQERGSRVKGNGPRPLDSLHESVFRQLVHHRISRETCTADFRTAEGQTHFQRLRGRYRWVAGVMSPWAESTDILPDLFAWYLLKVSQSAGLGMDEVWLAEFSVSASRRLRRRVAEFYDRRDAVRIARKRLKLATKMVERMKRLDRPCKPRDLARGFDNQKMEKIRPLIESLVNLGLVSRSCGWLILDPSADRRVLQAEDFMEAPRLVPYSIGRWLDMAENRQTASENEPGQEKYQPTN